MPCLTYLPCNSGMFQSSWCLWQPSNLWATLILLGCWTGLHRYSPKSLFDHISWVQMKPGPSPTPTHKQTTIQQLKHKWIPIDTIDVNARSVCTSSSWRMLQAIGTTDARLDAGIFCFSSSAAASSLSTFLLEITTWHPFRITARYMVISHSSCCSLETIF